MIQLMRLLGLPGDKGCDGDLDGASPELRVVWKDFSLLPLLVQTWLWTQSAPLTKVLDEPHTLPLGFTSCKRAQQFPSTQ